MHFNANGKIVGSIMLHRQDHANLKRQGKKIEFIHTRSYSGALIELRTGKIALGCCNIAGAGRGYVFSDLFELSRYCEKFPCNFCEEGTK